MSHSSEPQQTQSPVGRVRVRLQRQHARWLLLQPDFPNVWQHWGRRLKRKFSQVLIFCRKCHLPEFLWGFLGLVAVVYVGQSLVHWLQQPFDFSLSENWSARPSTAEASQHVYLLLSLAAAMGALVFVLSLVGRFGSPVQLGTAALDPRAEGRTGRQKSMAEHDRKPGLGLLETRFKEDGTRGFGGSSFDRLWGIPLILMHGLMLLIYFGNLVDLAAAQLVSVVGILAMIEVWIWSYRRIRMNAPRPDWMTADTGQRPGEFSWKSPGSFRLADPFVVRAALLAVVTAVGLFAWMFSCFRLAQGDGVGGAVAVGLVAVVVVVGYRLRLSQRGFDARYRFVSSYRLRPLSSVDELVRWTDQSVGVAVEAGQQRTSGLPSTRCNEEASRSGSSLVERESIGRESLDPAPMEREPLERFLEQELAASKPSWLRSLCSQDYVQHVAPYWVLLFVGGVMVVLATVSFSSFISEVASLADSPPRIQEGAEPAHGAAPGPDRVSLELGNDLRNALVGVWYVFAVGIESIFMVRWFSGFQRNLIARPVPIWQHWLRLQREGLGGWVPISIVIGLSVSACGWRAGSVAPYPLFALLVLPLLLFCLRTLAMAVASLIVLLRHQPNWVQQLIGLALFPMALGSLVGWARLLAQVSVGHHEAWLGVILVVVVSKLAMVGVIWFQRYLERPRTIFQELIADKKKAIG